MFFFERLSLFVNYHCNLLFMELLLHTFTESDRALGASLYFPTCLEMIIILMHLQIFVCTDSNNS